MREQTRELVESAAYEAVNTMRICGDTEATYFGTTDRAKIVDYPYGLFQEQATAYYGNKASNFDSKKTILAALGEEYEKLMAQD